MNHLTYGSFDSTNADIAFSDANGYTDPASETETRKQLSYPLKEIKTFLHDAISIDDSDNVIQLRVNSGKIQYRTSGNTWTDVSGGIPTGGTSGQVLEKSSSTDYDVAWKDNTLDVLTTAPASAYTGGGVKIVYLASEPATKYSGYIYLIKES